MTKLDRKINDDRPTDERMRRGKWAMPQGPLKALQPVVDMASDAVGLLHQRGLLTGDEEQAARHFQKLRYAYLQEIPDIAQFKSCIAGSVPGYDDGDGNADIIQAYREIEDRIGRKRRTIVLAVCEDGKLPGSVVALTAFRRAMQKIGG